MSPTLFVEADKTRRAPHRHLPHSTTDPVLVSPHRCTVFLPRHVDVWPTVRAAIKTEGIFSLWRGLGATLMRDVPFSAIYWTGYEALKRRYQAQHAGSFGAADVAVPAEVAFAAGATAGSVGRASA